MQFIIPPTCRDKTRDKASFLGLLPLKISGNNKKANSQCYIRRMMTRPAGRRLIAWYSGLQPQTSCTILPLALKSWLTSGWLLQQGGAQLHTKENQNQHQKCCLPTAVSSRPVHASLPSLVLQHFLSWPHCFPSFFPHSAFIKCYFPTLISNFLYPRTSLCHSGRRWQMFSLHPGWFTFMMGVVWEH